MPMFSIPKRGLERTNALRRNAKHYDDRERAEAANAHLVRTWDAWEKLPCPCCAEPIGNRYYVFVTEHDLAGYGVTVYAQTPQTDRSLFVHAICHEELVEKARLATVHQEPESAPTGITAEQRQTLAEGYDSEDAAYFTAVYTLDAFERRFGRLPEDLRASWTKLRAAADEMEATLNKHGATLDALATDELEALLVRNGAAVEGA